MLTLKCFLIWQMKVHVRNISQKKEPALTALTFENFFDLLPMLA